MSHHRDSREHEARVYRIAVGAANLALAAMLVYGISRYYGVMVPRFGNQFFYVPVVMGALAGWMVFRGVLALLGRRRGS